MTSARALITRRSVPWCSCIDHVLDMVVPWLDDFARLRHTTHLPVVLTHDEATRLISVLEGVPKLMASVLYGSGLRVLECARLRVKDLDFSARHIFVRRGKGKKDRLTLFPNSLREPLHQHLLSDQELRQFREVGADNLVNEWGAFRAGTWKDLQCFLAKMTAVVVVQTIEDEYHLDGSANLVELMAAVEVHNRISVPALFHIGVERVTGPARNFISSARSLPRVVDLAVEILLRYLDASPST